MRVTLRFNSPLSTNHSPSIGCLLLKLGITRTAAPACNRPHSKSSIDFDCLIAAPSPSPPNPPSLAFPSTTARQNGAERGRRPLPTERCHPQRPVRGSHDGRRRFAVRCRQELAGQVQHWSLDRVYQERRPDCQVWCALSSPLFRVSPSLQLPTSSNSQFQAPSVACTASPAMLPRTCASGTTTSTTALPASSPAPRSV